MPRARNPPRAGERRPPVVLVGSADGAISGWEIGESPRATLVLQPEGVSDADAERGAKRAVVVAVADAVVRVAPAA